MPILTTVGTRGINGEGLQAERRSGTGSADSGASRVIPLRNIIATAVPPHPSGAAMSNAAHPSPGVSASQPASDSDSLSSLLAEVNSQIRNLVGNVQGDNVVQSGSQTL